MCSLLPVLSVLVGDSKYNAGWYIYFNLLISISQINICTIQLNLVVLHFHLLERSRNCSITRKRFIFPGYGQQHNRPIRLCKTGTFHVRLTRFYFWEIIRSVHLFFFLSFYFYTCSRSPPWLSLLVIAELLLSSDWSDRLSLRWLSGSI